ncbi:MAG: hypothetical protein IIA61_00545 [Candidatus Marinimicrobia bacterium]|nr:hypothetical protein [Candidatus Neomarinimicrobiota bacterium]
MNPLQTAALGICFWVLSLAQVIVMAWMWKYNDPEKHTSDPHKDGADPWQTFLKKWLSIHRIIGYTYVIIYIFMMTKMVPRLWTYQIELPARTVVHLVLGFSIGIILISKIAVIRFFKHLGNALPLFGFLIFFFTTILLAVSVPFAYQEQRLIAATRAFSVENMTRIEHLLPKAGFSEYEARQLATIDVMKSGRVVGFEYLNFSFK